MTYESNQAAVGQRELHMALFDAMPGISCLIRTDAPRYTILAVTPQLLALAALKKEEVVGKGVFEVFPSNLTDRNDTGQSNLRASLDYVLRYKEPHQITVQRYDVALDNGNFTEKYWEAENRPVFSPDGEVAYIIHTSENITDQIKSTKIEQELESANQVIEEHEEELKRFKFMADNAQDPFILMREDGTFAYLNKKALEVWGYVEEEAKNIRVPDVDPIYQDEAFAQVFAQAQKGEVLQFETLHKRKDGVIYPVEVNMNGISLEGKPHLFAVARNITERKKGEEALSRSESNLRNMILQAPVATVIFRGPTYIVEIVNDRMCEFLGRSKEELLNKPIFEGSPEVKDQGYEELLNSVYTTGKRSTIDGTPVRVLRNSGIETAYINFLYEPYREADGTISGVIAVAMDVTEQVVARKKIEESNKEFQFVTDFMPQLIWVARPDGYHYYYNQKWYGYTGLTPGETEGEGWNAVFHPDDQERAWNLWRHSLETGEPYEIEYRCRRFDGVYRWVLGRALPLRDDAGNILKWFGTCTDIHDQKIEAQSLEEKVKERTRELESQKKELERSNTHLEDFAYAASHDLKEPIRKIRTFCDRLKYKLGDRLLDDDQHYFERMQNATERMQLLIDDLLEYSHVSVVDQNLDEINLNNKVELVLDDLEVEITEKNATVSVGELPVISGHRRQIQQLFQNLITNAIKFRKPNVSPVIRISSTVIIGENIGLPDLDEDSKNKLYNLIEVSDNGIGFGQNHSEKIFKMFQRLHGKAEYEGTGIGLAIVRKVVENHMGFVRAESKLGEGATFKVYLPVEP
jgi:PAS domain S-box-containing protein